ncbi:MAG: choice-of-anchor V domain-containing protein [Candidatus Thermoplasmatota archaeon]
MYNAIASAHTTGIPGYSKSGCDCHAIYPDENVTILIKGIPKEYKPNETYKLVIELYGPPQGRGGFDLSVDKGKFVNVSEDAKIFYDNEVLHISPFNNTWTVDWLAPQEKSGKVYFYISGNSVNGDGDMTGDKWNSAIYYSLEEGTIPKPKKKEKSSGFEAVALVSFFLIFYYLCKK